MTGTFKIEERGNGPLVVKGVTSMVDEDGTTYDVKEVMALCRCGGSSTKPFCDGSHRTNGFESRGGKPAGKDVLLPYVGAKQTVWYNPRICSHAAECARVSPKAFNSTKKPWIQPDEDTPEQIEAVVAACPSGALQLQEGGHRLADHAQIVVSRNGPYWVLNAELDADAPGDGAAPEKGVLCRCGLSGNKPWCDGAHSDKGWTAE